MLSVIANAIYYPLKIYLFVVGNLYFRKIKITGHENVPTKGPVILAINHQNALLDALLISALFRRNIFFFTRGDLFRSPVTNKILRGFKMLPVYRLRDGYKDTKRNDETFEASRKKLLKGGVIGIFPEGSHNLHYKIRPLKKGVARLAFITEEATDFASGLVVVPVGIQYESHFGPDGRTLISIGEPIKVADFKEIYISNQNLANERFLHALSERMKTLVIDIQGDYNEVYRKFMERRVYRNDLTDQLITDQALVRAIEKNTPFIQENEKVPDYKKALATLWKPIWFFIGFIPKSLVNILVRKFTRDPHYYGSMRFIYSIFLYPIFFLLLILVIRFLVS
ncbi:MAG: lysophospholipid acyltransferase family protein [Cyclobacteriaceae bacterium]|nr:lysophospholipid acyltransferase family protein [Cyclobacteriaceae bacterium]